VKNVEHQSARLLSDGPKVINLGLPLFYEALKDQGAPVIHVDWKPPAGGNEALAHLLAGMATEEIEKANREAAQRLIDSHPVLVDICRAADVIPGMEKHTILHAGPPISWERMCGPMKGAVIGALIYEGLATSEEEATTLAASGTITFDPCHHHQTVGPMAGVVSSSMYVFCVENRTFGNKGFCTLNEGLGKVLRFGAFDEEVITRLKWMEEVLAPALKKAIALSEGIDVKALTAQALMMGDECHNRNVAGTLLFMKEIMPLLIKTGIDHDTLQKIYQFISGNVHFFLNLSMAACKSAADAIKGFPNSTVISCMARNGVDTGIRIAGLGDEWFVAPSGNPRGLYFAGFSEEDGNPDLGDSTISEVAGIGAVAMASAPAIVRFVGGAAADAIKYTEQMYEITVAHHRDYQIPFLDFRGTPVAFDICKIVETGISPVINTGIAHKKAGIGQVGAGILYAPMACFEKALTAFGNLVAV
jgi:hypothetical protein